jgi:hypothetical protein
MIAEVLNWLFASTVTVIIFAYLRQPVGPPPVGSE